MPDAVFRRSSGEGTISSGQILHILHALCRHERWFMMANILCGVDLSARPFYLSDEKIDWVTETLHSLTLEEKAGQLFCVMGQSFSLSALPEMAASGRIGGILFRPEASANIRERYEILDAAAKIPLLKAANLEEGGRGGASDATLFGWPMTSAATDDSGIVEKFAALTAAEGRAIGINWTFSPVSDLDLNYLNPITNVRSCGSDIEKVEKFTTIYAQTMQRRGIAACAKHFPGDGVDFRDHHLHPTYNSLSADKWYESYGRIYQTLIANDLASIMVGHIVQPFVSMEINPALTPETCQAASLSPELMTGVLRERFGFNGVITTDATIMGGYCMSMERSKAIPASIMAGADMLVFNTDFEEDFAYIMNAVNSGALSIQRLHEAVTRILALKAAYCLDHTAPEYDEETLARADAWQQECADAAVTLVKNRGQILPITPERYHTIRLITVGDDNAADGSGSLKRQAADYLMQHGFAIEYYDPFMDDLHGTSRLSKNRLTLYLANCQTASNNTSVRIHWSKKHALDTPRFVHEEDCIFISLSNPYHLIDVPRVPVYINTYSATRPLLLAALEKVLGKSDFKGVSPVDAFCGLIDTRL